MDQENKEQENMDQENKEQENKDLKTKDQENKVQENKEEKTNDKENNDDEKDQGKKDEEIMEEKVNIDPNVIKSGDTVIFKKGEVLKAMKINSKKSITFERLRFTINAVIGCRFGGSYKVMNGALESVVSQDEEIPHEVKEAGVDNRSLNDTCGDSQSMEYSEIVKMKQSGASGSEIVASLINNSSSFAVKTVYSQNKYLKKKQKKHCGMIEILRPTARLLCKLYESRDPGKVCQMHVESLSQLLAISNIRSGSRCVVVETCSGVLLGSVLERMGGIGSMVNLHVGGETAPNLFALQHLNMPDEMWNTMHSLPMHLLSQILECTDDEQVNKILGDDDEEEEARGNAMESKAPTRKRKHQGGVELTREERLAIRMERRRKRRAHQLTAINLLRSRDLDCLIVACRMHPTPIVLKLLETLAPSRPFVVYCEHREPLMELFVSLTTEKRAINLHLTDTFMRYYQILPERSHPLVSMPGCRGYLLSGIKVVI